VAADVESDKEVVSELPGTLALSVTVWSPPLYSVLLSVTVQVLDASEFSDVGLQPSDEIAILGTTVSTNS
jgi:hypothetical protein